jgi:CheY-like chemotaxis protein
VSKDFIESDYIWGKELKVAMQREASGAAHVVPILVRAVSLEPDDAPFMRLQWLPTDMRAVTSWPNVDEAWTDVAKNLRATVKTIQARRISAATPPAAPAPVHAPADAPHAPELKLSLDARPIPDPLLDRVIDGVTRQVEAANAARGAAPLDTAALREQVLRLIDTPQQKRVLWVDDRPQGNVLEVATLAKLQIEVVAVRSTDEAMRQIDSDPEPFDLVISDWVRRGEGAEAGLALMRRLRAAGKAVPVVYYHGTFDAATRGQRAAQALAAGAFGEAVLPGELLSLALKAFARHDAGAAAPLAARP